MNYVKINESLYPATFSGKFKDSDWDNRASKTIRVSMDITTALELFHNDVSWSIVSEEDEFDNSDYSVRGDVTIHNDGTISIKMGQKTAEEILAEIMEVYND